MPINNNIWITWHQQARSKNLAKLLGLRLYEKQIDNNFISRHVGSFLWTCKILIKERPKVVYIQLSFLLLIAVCLYKKIRNEDIYIVTDCHTKALRRSMRNDSLPNKFLRMIKLNCFKLVDLSIISNSEMIEDMEVLNENYIILPDKIPDMKDLDILSNASDTNTTNYVVMVCSYAVDEPYLEMINAANYLPDDLTIYMTGKPPEEVKSIKYIPQNLQFTGYVSFEKYYRLIANAKCIVGLTTEKGCLQSCAYEGLAVKTPMVLSNTDALKNYFENSAIYTKHDAKSIAKSIKTAIRNKNELISVIRNVKSQRDKQFNKQISKLKNKTNLIM